MPIPPVHLAIANPNATRARVDGRAFPLSEAGQPLRDAAADIPSKKAALGGIVDWLKVESSARYKKGVNVTYCNIYACDFCYLAQCYLPRVWWMPDAIKQLTAGATVPVTYGKTVGELNANSLFEWLVEYGAGFGWNRTLDLTALQESANGGGVGIVCAKRTVVSAPGHITIVVPETVDHKAARAGGQVSIPLQSQAGATNFRYGTGSSWWTEKKFRDSGFWMHT